MNRFFPAAVAATMFSASFASAAAMAPTPTHLYTFNDGTATDSIGNANGVLMGGATVSGGKLQFDPTVNNGLNSPSTGQYMALPYNIAQTPSFTIEEWATDRSNASWQRLFDMGNPGGGSGFQMFAAFGYAGEGPFGQVTIGSTDYVTTTTIPTLNVEHQFVYVYNAVIGYEFLYMDGAQLAYDQATQNPGTSNFSDFWIGRSDFSLDPYFDGTIDQLAVYNTGLTAAQVSADYAAKPVPAAAVPEPGTLALTAIAAAACRRRSRFRRR